MYLQGKTVLVTGASGGIGRCIAKELALKKADLLLVGRDKNALLETQSDIEVAGGSARILVADLLQESDRALVASACLQLPTGLHGLINNAGSNHFALLDAQTDAMIQSQLSLNLLVPMLLTRSLIPALLQSPGARILNIGSTFGSIGYPGYTAYCASKFGLRGFTESLRREMADADLQVLYFAPRATRTRLNPGNVVALNDELGNVMDLPEDVAKQAVRLFIHAKPQQLFMGWPEKFFARVNQIFPSLVDGALKKQLPIIKRYATHSQEL